MTTLLIINSLLILLLIAALVPVYFVDVFGRPIWEIVWTKFFPKKEVDDGKPKPGGNIFLQPGKGKNGGPDGKIVLKYAQGKTIVTFDGETRRTGLDIVHGTAEIVSGSVFIPGEPSPDFLEVPVDVDPNGVVIKGGTGA